MYIVQLCWSFSIRLQDLHAQDKKPKEQMKIDLEEFRVIAESEPDFYVPDDRKLGPQITSRNLYTPIEATAQVLDFERRIGRQPPDNWSCVQASDRIEMQR